jgi:phage tail protein X
VHSWIRNNLVRRRLVQTSAISLLLGSAAIYVAAHSRGVTTHPSTATKADPPSAVATPSAESWAGKPAQTSRQDNSSDTFMYVVQPSDTIQDICVSTFGRYDDTVLREVRRLNPGLKDLSRLETGQEIRLPLTSVKKGSSGPSLP